jgi:hypothetical protein
VFDSHRAATDGASGLNFAGGAMTSGARGVTCDGKSATLRGNAKTHDAGGGEGINQAFYRRARTSAEVRLEYFAFGPSAGIHPGNLTADFADGADVFLIRVIGVIRGQVWKLGKI